MLLTSRNERCGYFLVEETVSRDAGNFFWNSFGDGTKKTLCFESVNTSRGETKIFLVRMR